VSIVIADIRIATAKTIVPSNHTNPFAAFTIIAIDTRQYAAFQFRGVSLNDCLAFSNQESVFDSIPVPPCVVSFSINLAVRGCKVNQGFANLQKVFAGDYGWYDFRYFYKGYGKS